MAASSSSVAGWHRRGEPRFSAPCLRLLLSMVVDAGVIMIVRAYVLEWRNKPRGYYCKIHSKKQLHFIDGEILARRSKNKKAERAVVGWIWEEMLV